MRNITSNKIKCYVMFSSTLEFESVTGDSAFIEE